MEEMVCLVRRKQCEEEGREGENVLGSTKGMMSLRNRVIK